MPVKFIFKIPQMSVWMLLHQTYNSISRCEEALFAQFDLTARQHAILMAIKYIDAPANPTQIADWVDRNLNSITLIVDRMEKNGLVRRTRDPEDRRSFRLVVTEKGEEYLKRSAQEAITLVMRLLENLSEEELQLLKTLLEKVRLQAIQYRQTGQTLKEIVTREDPQMVHLSKQRK